MGEFLVTNHGLSETDGRHRRSARTRQHLIEAYLDLLRENSIRPTADKIAKQAGCATRSVYQHFSDLQRLRLAAADYAWLQASAQAVTRDVDSDRLSRIRSQVETRSAICEQWLPLWRSMLHNQHGSEELLRRIELRYDVRAAGTNVTARDFHSV
jgi:AcrR family transcriptional regulator